MIKSKIFKYLENVNQGCLEIITPENQKVIIGDKNSQLKANIKINDWSLLSRSAARGDIGFGEGYMLGLFTTDNLIDLLSFFVVNQEKLEDIFHGNLFISFVSAIGNLFRRNTIKGSKKNISFHYDISNDFFSLWLDPSMTYSSGIFFNSNDDLTTAQQNKYSRILSNIPSENKSILEIGCGWGGFLENAAKKNHQLTALTLSKEQRQFAIDRLEKQNLSAQILLEDYRHHQHQYDNIVSIEMFEAVGKQYWPTFFNQIKSLLKKDGKAMIQTITIDDRAFDKYCKTNDFIRKYIFPGGFLPSENIFENLAKASGLEMIDKFDFAHSYYQTLKIWLDNFNNKLPAIKQLGFDDLFVRKWQFYLAYCAAGFYGKRTNVLQYSFVA